MKIIKKITAIICATVLATLTACAGGVSPDVGSTTASHVTIPDLEEISGTITVSAFESMTHARFLEEAAKAFEERYPGTTVNIELVQAMPEVRTTDMGDGRTVGIMEMEDDTGSRNDYIQAINTELMSGRGPDILAMDILPLATYIERGVLADLKPFMEQDPSFNMNDLRGNILEASMYGNGLYMMPMDFMFNVYAYDSYLIPGVSDRLPGTRVSAEDLFDIGREVFGEVNSRLDIHAYMFNLNGGNQRPSMFQTLLFEENFNEFVDMPSRTADFTGGSFAALLNRIQQYTDSGYLRTGMDFTQITQMSPEEINDMLERMQTERFFFKTKSALSLTSSFYQSADGMRLMRGIGLGNEEDDKIAGIQSNRRGETPFQYTQAYAINANSDNKATAWAFIRFLTSEEMQTSMNLMGLPINNNAFADRLERNLLMHMGVQSLDAEGQRILAEYIATVSEFADAVNTLFIQSETIRNTINTEMEHFFDGTRSAEDVAGIIQNRVGLYLNE